MINKTDIQKLRDKYGIIRTSLIVPYKITWRIIAKIYKIYLRRTTKPCNDIIIFMKMNIQYINHHYY